MNELATKYQNGENLSDVDLQALIYTSAADGYVVLPGNLILKSRVTAYDPDDLLLPPLWRDGPQWFSWDPRREYFVVSIKQLVTDFARAHNLTRHKGQFFSNGDHVDDQAIRDALHRSLSIVRANPAKPLDDCIVELRQQVKDDAPPEARQRLSIEALAAELEKLGYGIKLNLITREYDIEGQTDTGRTMKLDDLVTVLHDMLAEAYKGASISTIEMYLSYIGRERAYNPILELLESTQFDGVSRITQLYTMLGIDDDDLSQSLVLKWLYQSVALLFNREDDPFGADGILVLNSPQGFGKTSLFGHLALKSAWFGEGRCIKDYDKDTARRVITAWISELGEVEQTMKTADAESLKAFITQRVDSYRLPYGRSDVVSPRHTSLCATGNHSDYLVDTTGNRRFWTVPLNRQITREELESLDALQLWAEVYAFVSKLPYKQMQSCFRLSVEEREALTQRNTAFERPVKAQREIEDILSMAKEKGLIFRRMTPTEFKNHWDVLRAYSAEQIGRALKKIGIESEKGVGGKRTCELPVYMKADSPFQENAV